MQAAFSENSAFERLVWLLKQEMDWYILKNGFFPRHSVLASRQGGKVEGIPPPGDFLQAELSPAVRRFGRAAVVFDGGEEMFAGLGVVAGLGTAFIWSVSGMINAAVARTLGVNTYILLRQPISALILGLACLGAGQFGAYPWQAVLAVSGSAFLGLILCDWCMFSAILHIGIRAALVCQSLYSCITALLGVWLYDEYLGMQGVAGLMIATFGVMLVILAEKRDAQGIERPRRQRALGIALALLSGVFMAVGLVLSKEALRCGIPPLMVTFMRNAVGCALVWTLALGMGRGLSAWRALHAHREVWFFLPIGCLLGPIGGVWLSTVALENLPAAVASTLIGLEPVALVVVSGVVERRCPSAGAIAGSIAACGGAALLLLR